MSASSAHPSAGSQRDSTAYFASREGAEKARNDLKAAGFPEHKITIEDGISARPDQDHGYVVRVSVAEHDLERAADILSRDNTLELDQRMAHGSMMDQARDAAARAKDAIADAGESVSEAYDSVRSRVGQIGSAAERARRGAEGVLDQAQGHPLVTLGVAFAVGWIFGKAR